MGQKDSCALSRSFPSLRCLDSSDNKHRASCVVYNRYYSLRSQQWKKSIWHNFIPFYHQFAVIYNSFVQSCVQRKQAYNLILSFGISLGRLGIGILDFESEGETITYGISVKQFRFFLIQRCYSYCFIAYSLAFQEKKHSFDNCFCRRGIGAFYIDNLPAESIFKQRK